MLELGPLEGAHTYMLDRAGASEVVAIEGNTRAFLKCLITKELLSMPSARFLVGTSWNTYATRPNGSMSHLPPACSITW